MGCKCFFCGMGVGMAAGAVAGMMLAGKKKPKGAVGRFAKILGNVADELGEMLG